MSLWKEIKIEILHKFGRVLTNSPLEFVKFLMYMLSNVLSLIKGAPLAVLHLGHYISLYSHRSTLNHRRASAFLGHVIPNSQT